MNTRIVAPAAILLLWLASIFMPVADTVSPSGRDTATGLIILALGWAGPLIGQFGWYANLLLPIALLVAAKWPAHRQFIAASAVILFALAINTMFWSSIPMDNGENVIVTHRWGYWLWMASVISGALWLAIDLFKRGENSRA